MLEALGDPHFDDRLAGDAKRAALRIWAPDSVGDRFFSDNDVAAAAAAPPLADAILPAKEELARESTHWAIAIFGPGAGGRPGRARRE